MQLLRSSESKRLPCIQLIIVLLVLASCSMQLMIEPSIFDQRPTSTPTLAPVSTTVFADLEPFVAPEYLEAEPVEVEPFPNIEKCEDEWVQNEVLAVATDSAHEIKIDCHLTLARSDTVTKRLIFETSGVTLECNGAKITGGETPDDLQNVNYDKDMIEVRSTSMLVEGERIWKRPRSITIRGCDITGSVRVWGMATNGEGTNPLVDDGVNHFRASSREEGHTERARANAPTNIVFDGIIVTGVKRNPVYFAPGVTSSQLINSEIKGNSEHVAVYLDAESYANTIKNNYIHTSTGNEIFERWDRPLIAIDGSSYNKILNNWFSNLSQGGIYLYRNCGLGGVVRHATPSYNQIINNVFYYNRYRGSNPAVYLGSRDYGASPNKGPSASLLVNLFSVAENLYWNFHYCSAEDGYDFGSSVSNKDHATHNVIMQNQIFVRSVDDMIRTKNPSINSPNYIDYNHTVTEDTAVRNGLAGCYIADGYRDFILHGSVVDLYRGSDNIPVCTNYQDTCNDGELIRSINSNCELTTVEFDCSITGSNDGCIQNAICPANRRIVAATAACNLEWGTISDASLMSVPGNIIKVLRASDAVSSGRCWIGNYIVQQGEKQVDGLVASFGVSVGCDEYDENGGDCQIRGVLYCR